jgi:3-isopropylmalate/(R)-2-methylmalate dehydratase small subunit
MVSKGKCHRLGDDVNTDYVIASKYRSMGLDFKAMTGHLFEDLDPNLSKRIREGDFLVAGKNFGCGSSREFAPRVIREAGVPMIFALSYARIFYRNALNVGLWLLECDTVRINNDDQVEVDLDSWVLKDVTQGFLVPINPLPPFLLQILQDGGLVPHFRKWGGFHFASKEG